MLTHAGQPRSHYEGQIELEKEAADRKQEVTKRVQASRVSVAGGLGHVEVTGRGELLGRDTERTQLSGWRMSCLVRGVTGQARVEEATAAWT